MLIAKCDCCGRMDHLIADQHPPPGWFMHKAVVVEIVEDAEDDQSPLYVRRESESSLYSCPDCNLNTTAKEQLEAWMVVMSNRHGQQSR